MRFSRIAAVATLGLLGLSACNEAIIPNYNAPTQFTNSGPGFQSAVLGTFPNRSDVGNWAIWSSGMAREATYFTPSEERFVTELTGLSPIQPDDFIGATLWDNLFGNIKTADAVALLIPSSSFNNTPLTGNQQEAVYGYTETGKALSFMFIAMSRDSLGVPMNAVGQTAPPYAPFLCNPLVWQGIVAMLDTADDSLAVAGAASPADSTPFPFALQPGLATVSRNALTFRQLTLALRAKAEVELGNAIARNDQATEPPFSAGAQAEFTAAVTDLDSATLLYSPILTPGEAIPGSDNGVFWAYSTQSGDIVNPIFTDVKGYYALAPFVDSINTADKRFTSKFQNKGTPPTAASAAIAVFNADQSASVTVTVAGNWNYDLNLNGSTTLTLIRNVELNFIMARAQLGLGNISAAVGIMNLVRTNVGGIGGTTASTYDQAKTLITDEARLTFIAEATGEDILATRDYGEENNYMNLWTLPSVGNTDLQTTTLVVPNTEVLPRGGNVQPVCTGAPASVVSQPLAATKAKRSGVSAMPNRIMIRH